MASDKDFVRLNLLNTIVKYLDQQKKKNLQMIKRLDNFANKYDYNIDVLKSILALAQQGLPGSVILDNKKYRLTESDLRFLLSVNGKTKEGGFIPLLPILGALAAGGIAGLAGKRIIENHKQLQEAKAGGLLPLLGLLPAIFGGLAAAGGVAGGIAQGVKAANDRKAQDEEAKRDMEFKKQQLEILKNSQGSGIVADKLQQFGQTLENTGSKVKGFFDSVSEKFRPGIEKIFRKLSKDFNIQEKHDGNGLYLELRPNLGSGIFLPGPPEGNGIFLPKIE